MYCRLHPVLSLTVFENTPSPVYLKYTGVLKRETDCVETEKRKVRRGGTLEWHREGERGSKNNWSRRNLIYNSKLFPMQSPPFFFPFSLRISHSPLRDVVWSPSLHNQDDKGGSSLCGHCDSWLAHHMETGFERLASSYFKRTVPCLGSYTNFSFIQTSAML